MEAAWAEFRDIVGKGNISLERSELESHSGSSWSSHPALPGDVPFCVVKPGSTEEVSAIMKVCHERKIPVTPYSGGTSLEGHFAATKGGICVDFSRMDKILKLHKDDLDVVVQPAVGWELLNEELAKDKGQVMQILKEGTFKAREAAAQTMDEVRRALGLSYF